MPTRKQKPSQNIQKKEVEVIEVELTEEDKLVLEGFHVAYTIFSFAEKLFIYSRKLR